MSGAVNSGAAGDAGAYRNALPPGTELMEYRLEAVLGAGGFGLTYLAWDAHLQKRVALKEFLPADIALRALDGSIVPIATQRHEDYRWGLERFLQEARTLARFSHPHIVRVLRYFEANNTGYMVMDYEHGESFSRLLKREPCPPEERLRAILMPLLDGLRAVHEAGFLHRDIKPSNVFLREQGGPLLIDFGAARHAVGGAGNYTAVVTPGYAPMEQYSGQAAQGPWSDIYAVAGVFFRAVTDEAPPDAVGRMRRDVVGGKLAAARSRYSAMLLAAIGWGLEIDEKRRPQTVAEWQEALLGSAAVPYTLSEPADPHGPPAPAPALEAADARSAAFRRYRWVVAIAVVLAVMLWRAYDSGTTTVETAVPAPAPAPPVTTVQPAPPAVQPAPPARAREAPQVAKPHPAPPRPRTPAADTVPPAEPAAADAAVPAGEWRAPVRDAVALPPLADTARERPGRERSARPGRER